jgi:hypothetical protein
VDVRRRVIDLCSELPGVTSEGDQHVGFLVRQKRFAWLLEDHHGDGRLALNCKAPPGVNTELAEADPQRYFVPSYLGPRGWLGMWLDVEPLDWEAVERALLTAYGLAAPKSARSAKPG